MNQDILKIDNHKIALGESKVIDYLIGRLPSGTKIHVTIHVYRSHIPGPTVLLLGGLHGDEINGIEILRKSLEKGYYNNLLRGSVIVIPCLNVYGFINFSRELPDGKDINRSFPGTSAGSLASRVAYFLTRKILPVVDFGIDFHTGGGSRYNYPQIRYGTATPENKELATAFCSPFTIEKGYILRSFRKIAKDKKVPIIVYEGGESKRMDAFSITKGLEGIKNILAYKSMIDRFHLVEKKTIHITSTSWLRAPSAGIFNLTVLSGGYIYKGEEVGVLSDVDNFYQSIVYAKKDGYIIGHNSASVVNQGDALFHIGVKKI